MVKIPSAFPALLLGLLLGAAGSYLFSESLLPEQGSMEEKAARLEVKLRSAENRIAALESDPSTTRPKRTLQDEVRSIAEDIRAGRNVTPDDIFRASQPLLRDLAPLFERMRLREQQARMDSVSGEMARKYSLTPSQQEDLSRWFESRAESTAKAWNDLLTRDGTRLIDLTRAVHEMRPDEGLDAFMAGMLTGDKLKRFQADRLSERAHRVQQEADTRTERLDKIVSLDTRQRDQVFGIMARSSRDYDPAMRMEGETGTIPGTSATGWQGALSVLRPDQRSALEAERERRRVEAEKDLQELGLALPEGWDFLDPDVF